MLKARLADNRNSLASMKLKMGSYISMIRNILDPYEPDFTELDIARASVLMQDLTRLHTDANRLKAQIRQMEKDLDG